MYKKMPHFEIVQLNSR